MPTTLGSLRRLVLTPSLAEVTFAKRGFPGADSAAAERLEAIPQSVICGFEWGIDCRSPWELERRLSLVEPELRGFAYEGAAMACTVLDAMAGGRGTKTRELMRGPAEPHLFLSYIGIGFAMARLPRPLWRTVSPDLTGSPFYPTMSWLAVDGYGFDRAYFDTRVWVEEQRVPRPYPWQGLPGYFARAFDQGVGRALWFIHGARVPGVVAAVGKFEERRRPDLWAGVGLAAAFAGGCSQADLAELGREAGPYAAELALGVVFAVTAREYSGHVPAHTESAVSVLTGLTKERAFELALETAVPPEAVASGETPPYEVWRARIRAHFTADRHSV